MPKVRLCPKGYGAVGTSSKTEFEEILLLLGFLLNTGGNLMISWRAKSLAAFDLARAADKSNAGCDRSIGALWSTAGVGRNCLLR